MIKKVLIRLDKRFYWIEGDLHTNYGVVKEKDLKGSDNVVKSHEDKEFLMFDANFIDQFEKIKRGPAIMTPKDIGIIISNTGIGKDSVVLDAGTGCGVTASLLARVVKKVITYEVNNDFFNLAKKNFEFLEIKNVEQKNSDVYEGIAEKDLDLITLDLPEPWKILKHAHKSLKSGCFLVSYLPTITQVGELASSCEGFLHEKTLEILEREWHVEGKKVRPKSQMIGHTGFLVFLRKV
jgi:tRNA (adenine57-N1/adenine58-N1)-methyltransferase